MPTSWPHRYARRTASLTSSTIRELLKLTERPEVISFAGGLPAPELFPLEAFRSACHDILTDPAQAQRALQYSPTEGFLPLREMVVRHVRRYGLEAAGPQNVLITSGSQQALDLVAKLLINPGDRVLVEAPTYLGALQAFNVLGADYVSVPVDGDGLLAGRLEDALRLGPKLMYLLPNFQNPSGATLSLERRRTVAALADQSGVPIVEDDPYGQLRYEGAHLPPLFALDPSQRQSNGARQPGGVIYLSTFSKTLAPGLRLGWIVAPADVIARLVQLKQGADLHTSTFAQMLAYQVARGGRLDRHIRRLRQVYRRRRDVMLAALAEHFPPGVTWTAPAGGLFLWLRLPEGMSARRLLETALNCADPVAFVPGDAFFAPAGPGSAAGPEAGDRHGRLNFSSTPPELIPEGIRRLAVALREQQPQRVPA